MIGEDSIYQADTEVASQLLWRCCRKNNTQMASVALTSGTAVAFAVAVAGAAAAASSRKWLFLLFLSCFKLHLVGCRKSCHVETAFQSALRPILRQSVPSVASSILKVTAFLRPCSLACRRLSGCTVRAMRRTGVKKACLRWGHDVGGDIRNAVARGLQTFVQRWLSVTRETLKGTPGKESAEEAATMNPFNPLRRTALRENNMLVPIDARLGCIVKGHRLTTYSQLRKNVDLNRWVLPLYYPLEGPLPTCINRYLFGNGRSMHNILLSDF